VKRTYSILLTALISLPAAAQAQSSALPVPTPTQRTHAMQLVQQCENADGDRGRYNPGLCFANHMDNGIDGMKDQNWNKAIIEESDAIDILVAYPKIDTGAYGLKGGTLVPLNGEALPYFYRSNAYLERKQYNLAAADATTSITLSPADPVLLNNRCWIRAIVGDLAGAQQDCTAALALTPKDPAVLDSAGFVYLKMKNYPAAITNYQAALKQSPKQASSLYGLGLAQQAQGNQAEGAQSIAAAQQIDPKITTDFGT
jgi:tetratricopeptide (TPR) repeat protein